MNLTELVLLAVALAMDCFAVSIACGMILKKADWRIFAQISLLFGLFQALMPLGGWLATAYWAQHIEAFGHWIAFATLSLLGIRMVTEKNEINGHTTLSPTLLRTQLTLAIATSIDALAVGLSMAVTGFSRIEQLTLPLLIIGAVSSLFALIGCGLGCTFGRIMEQRLRPTRWGGIILIAIGLKILLTQLH